jgi:hypothetical protein
MTDRNNKTLGIGVFVAEENIIIFGRNNLVAALHYNQSWFVLTLIAF